MKYLAWLLILMVVIWWFRQKRQSHSTEHKESGAQVMVPCSECGAHVPASDAIRGAKGVYCSKAHRQSHEA